MVRLANLPQVLLAIWLPLWLWNLQFISAHAPESIPFGDTGEIQICSDTIIRVIHRPSKSKVTKTSLIAKETWPPVKFQVDRHDDVTTVETARLRVVLTRSTGQVVFEDKAQDKRILQEDGHSFIPSHDMGQHTYQVEQSWMGSEQEGLFGGGSYQSGLVNFKYAPIQMVQFNTEAVVPFFLSTEGYGLLWDNYAWTYLNPPQPSSMLVPCCGAATGTTNFIPKADGDHFFYLGDVFPKPGMSPSWGANQTHWPNAEVNLTDLKGHNVGVIQWNALPNMPSSLVGRAVGLKRGIQYKISYRWDVESFGLYVQGPEYRKTVLRSFLGDLIDYYFVLGASADEVVSGYRAITGVAPLYPRWVYGFWQCREHYESQTELLDAATGFRKRSIPLDAIVQDWLYWGDLGWGPQWDLKRYPNPAGMVAELHAQKLHFMVSVWSRFDNNTSFYKEMNAKGWILGQSTYYDAWNPEARELFYNFSKTNHFTIGVDALWLDATEPEFFPNINERTFLGSGNAYMNSYSLETTRAISTGLRRDFARSQGARVFSLTRSSFAGQQRTGAALWSGDIGASWDSLRRQVAASINYQLSGMPYWSEDIGGFFRPHDQYSSPEYHDLLIRWFQFGVFTPIFRVHGAGSHTEIWNYGPEVMSVINSSAISLRYRLVSYIYSGFARVEFDDYTMQRALIMDFPEDKTVVNIADEFMWGDAFLVAPILNPMDQGQHASTRSVYLPQGSAWVNFHTGAVHSAGHARLKFQRDEAPVFVRSGSIVVMASCQTADGCANGALEVRIYAGADAAFKLFEDDGKSAAYKNGQATTIEFAWMEAQGVLVLGRRNGHFPGMAKVRQMSIVWVRPGQGVGANLTHLPDAVVQYDGQPASIKRVRNPNFFV